MYFQLIVMQVISLVAAGINFFLLPNLLSISDYGLYQLYFLVIGLAGFFHLGAIDGLQLKLGGTQKKVFINYLGNITISMIIINIIIVSSYVVWALIFKKLTIENIIILIAIFSGLLINLTSGGILVLGALGKGTESLLVSNSSRVLFIIGIMLCILLKIKSVPIYITIFIISNILSILQLNHYIAIPIKVKSIKIALIKCWQCISVGSKMLIANGATQLIVSIGALCIQWKYEITTFAKISFANGLIIMAISLGYTIGGLVYAEACKRKINSIPEIHPVNILYPGIIFCGILLVTILPINYIIENWISNYIESIKYINLLFICVLYDGIYSIVVLPMMKFHRMELTIFKINILALIFDLILIIIGIWFSMDAYYYVFVTTICFVVRSIASIIATSRMLKFNLKVPSLLIIILTIGYIFSLNTSGFYRITSLLLPVTIIILYGIKSKLLIVRLP